MSAPLSGLALARQLLTEMREAVRARDAHCQADEPVDPTAEEVRAWNATADRLRAREESTRIRFAAHVAWMIETGQLTERTP